MKLDGGSGLFMGESMEGRTWKGKQNVSIILHQIMSSLSLVLGQCAITDAMLLPAFHHAM